MTERLTEKFKDGRNIIRKGIENIHHVDFGRFYAGRAIDKLAEYETAEEENRVMPKLPVEINKVIYVPIDFKNRIFSATLIGFVYSSQRKKWVYVVDYDGGIAYEAFDDFNKTYFETYDKAEQALKEMRRDDLLTK